MSNLESGSLVGRYRIVRFLGAGAMGEVYLAEDPHIERPLAIKTVRLVGRPQELEERKRRLLREARAAGRLLHPNVVTLFDAGEQDGLLFLAFEFVEGSDLASRLETQGALSLGDVLKVIRQCAEALDYAHRQGIVHRDIKPSNILIDTAGRVKVADFGIAKMAGQSTELTIAGSVMGSPQYLSPEQIRGEDLDGRSDVFSLGVVLYELLSAKRPFEGESITTLVYQILHKEPPAISELRAVPPRLEELLRRMLAKDRDERMSVAAEVANEVAAIERELPDETLAAPADRLDRTYVLPKRSSGAMPSNSGPALPPLPPLPIPSPSTKVSQAPRQEERTAALPPPLPLQGPPPVPTPVSPVVMPVQGMAPIREGRSWTPLVVLGIAALLVVALSAALGWRWVSGRIQSDKTVAAPGTSVPAQAAVPPLADPSSPSPPSSESDLERDPDEPPAGVSPSAAQGRPIDPVRPPDTSEERPAQSSRTPTPVPSQPTTQPVPQPPRQESPRREVPRPVAPVEEPAMPTTSATPAPEPEPEEAEPAPSSSSRSFQADNVVKTGLGLAFRVNPSDAFILVDGKVIGRAEEWSGQKRNRSYSLPGPGTYEIKIRKEGLREHRIAVEAGATGGITPVFARLQPLAPPAGTEVAEAGAGDLKVYRVSEAVAFRLRAPAAMLLVDGQQVGPARQYSGGLGRGEWLRLPEGRHRISIVAPGFRRQDFIVEVFPGAPQQRERIPVDLSPGGDQ